MLSFVIRSDEDKARLIAAVKMADWSFKVYVQPLFPKATPSQYKYLFGVFYKRIADFMGEPSVWSVHDIMMEHFEVEYSPLPDGWWEFRKKSGSEWTTISIAQYIERIAAFFLVEFGLVIEEPYETFVNE